MKTFILLLATCCTVLADAPAPTADELRNAPTVDGQTVLKTPSDHEGKIVRIRFTARGSKVTTDPKDGKSRGELGVEAQGVWYNIKVIFPTSQVEWFTRIPNSGGTVQFVYARISHGNGHLLGLQVREGAKGPEFAW